MMSISATDWNAESSLVSAHNFSSLHQVLVAEVEAVSMYQSLAMHA